MKNRGRPKIEQSKRRKHLDITLSHQAIEQARIKAENMGLSVSAYIETLIRTDKAE